MLTRRSFTRGFGMMAACGCALPDFVTTALAQGMSDASPTARGTILIKNAAVISMDQKLGVMPRADVLVRDGVIEAVGENLADPAAEIIDAQDMIVIARLFRHALSHVECTRPELSRGRFRILSGQGGNRQPFLGGRFYNSIMLAMAELANNVSRPCTTGRILCARPRMQMPNFGRTGTSRIRARYSYGHIDGLARDVPLDFKDIERVRSEWSAQNRRSRGLVHLGVNLRGVGQATEEIFHRDVAATKERKLAIAVHAGQTPPNRMSAADYEKRGYIGRIS